jgi:tRNA threonylcarbamoyl adenosine modification protein YeaZ
MIVLGIDGALGGFSAAVARDGELLASFHLPGNVALEQGLQGVDLAMRRAAVRPKDVDRIAVVTGPGSFTGARIAISYAKALALGWKCPLAGVGSFDCLEAGLHLEEPVLTVVRGRKGVISVRYRGGGGGTVRASGYVRDVLDGLALPLSGLSVVGQAQDVLPALAERGGSVMIVDPALFPAASAAALLGVRLSPAESAHQLRADYGELPPVGGTPAP